MIATTGFAQAGGSVSGTVNVALQDLYLKTGYVIGLSIVSLNKSAARLRQSQEMWS